MLLNGTCAVLPVCFEGMALKPLYQGENNDYNHINSFVCQ